MVFSLWGGVYRNGPGVHSHLGPLCEGADLAPLVAITPRRSYTLGVEVVEGGLAEGGGVVGGGQRGCFY